MSWWKKTALVLANIGAINWGLSTLQWNLVEKILGVGTTANVVYWIIALCGLYALVLVFKE